MTPEQLISAITARYSYDQSLQRQGWEQARVIGYFAVAPHLKKGTIGGPKDLFALPWDGEGGTKPKTVAELSEAAKAWIRKHDENEGITTNGI